MPSAWKSANSAIQNSSRAVGTANALTTLSNYVSPTASADRASARLLKEQREQELANAKANRESTAELSARQIQAALQETKLAQAELARRTTFESFTKYNSDGDVRHLNNALNDLSRNSIGSRLFPNALRIDKLSPNDSEMLNRLGLSWAELEANPEVLQEFVKVTNKDGTQTLLAMEELYAGTGYTNYMTQQELDTQLKRAEIFQRTRMQSQATRTELERTAATMTRTQMPAGMNPEDWVEGQPEYDLAYIENLRKVRQEPRGSQTQREAEATRITALLNPDDPEWRAGNPEYDTVYQEEFAKLTARDARTSTQKELTNAREIKETIRTKTQELGANSFFNIDFNVMENRLAFEEDIQELMTLGNLELTTEDRRSLHHIKELLTLGDTAKDITPRETGFIDNIFRNVGRYVRDDVQGMDMRAAYTTFRNTLQHALFGSTLTAGEINNMLNQFGSLSQQRGPVLAQFQVALEQVRAKLESVASLGDSYVSHFYIGADQQKLDEIISAIDNSINEISNIEPSVANYKVSNPTVNQVQRQEVTPDVQTGLQNLYNEIYGVQQ